MDIRSFARDVEARLTAVGDRELPPSGLADLFRLTFEPSAKGCALLNLLHKHLLKRTVEHARAETQFYADGAYDDLPAVDAHEPPDLTPWPVTERDDVMTRFDDFVARDVTFASAVHTSGSTGPSLTVYKSSEELAFLWSYYEHLQRPSKARMDQIPLILFLPNLYHGSGIPLPSVGKVFISGVTDDTLIADAAKILLRTYNLPGCEPRISLVTGLSFHIKLLTLFLLEHGHDLTGLGVRGLNVVGEYAPRIGRSFLADAWDAPVYDRFTLTESVGGATRCLKCDHLHLDPHIVGEVLDADTGEPIDEGVGYLVITDLYPFVRMQPMLRYRTGDLVQNVPSDCANTLTFDFLGKAMNCLGYTRHGNTHWLLYSARLHDIVSEIPDIRTFDTFPNLRSLRDTTAASPPIFTQQLTHDDSRVVRITLTFELRYAPEYFRDRVSQIRANIEDRLMASSSALIHRLAANEVSLHIDFVGPGALGDAYRVKV